MDKQVSRSNPPMLNSSGTLFERLTGDMTARILAAGSDIALVLSPEGIIRDVGYASSSLAQYRIEDWVGRAWRDTVTIESGEKIDALFTEAASVQVTRKRQVNHPARDQDDLPVDYLLMSLDQDGTKLALGTDLRQMSQIQGQVVRLQLELETEYRRIREAQSRYRIIFQMSTTPMLVVDGAGVVLDANSAFSDLVERDSRKVVGSPLAGLLARDDREQAGESIKKAHYGGEVVTFETGLAANSVRRQIVIEPFRESGRNSLLMRFEPVPAPNGERRRAPHPNGERWLDCVPESLVVINAEGAIEDANDAFLDLVKVLNKEWLVGRNLHNWLGASSVDMQVLMSHVRETGEIRRFSSLVRDEMGGTLPVTVSATRYASNGQQGNVGVLLAEAPRREPPVFIQAENGAETTRDFSELVGRVPLKELVRDAVDVIEKMCIEAALNQTDNNRASAADLLGLSRQSLYIKLKRHGLQAPDVDE